MQRHNCHCPRSALQWISLCLNQDTLPFDSILQLGSELTGHIKTVLECPRCPATRRMTQMLSQTTSRLVCFYEAVFLNAATNLASARRGANEDPAAPECRSVFCEMSLGKLPLQGAEARMLIEVVLVEACLDLNERIQEWKLVVDELLEDERPQDQSDSISRCLDRLAKLIGLLQFDGLPMHCS
ncbi:hypothetical protein ESCO_003940 [Escovopsis weberi]|uniref:Uncharacterized protein n=1 Tax=Escovopsis weberi TaxID=150374 RepID=A0A0M9VX89_ESCWE|nr:hypothetical protein ESCO_003940 [Escovopsis weberi]